MKNVLIRTAHTSSIDPVGKSTTNPPTIGFGPSAYAVQRLNYKLIRTIQQVLTFSMWKSQMYRQMYRQ